MSVKTCPWCAEDIPATASVCPLCKTDLGPQGHSSRFTRPGELIAVGAVAYLGAGVFAVVGLAYSITALMIVAYVVGMIGSMILLTGLIGVGVAMGIRAARE